MHVVRIRITTMSTSVKLKIQVKWAEDNLDGYLNFYSVSGDGRVTNWTIVKTALWYSDIMLITFSKNLENFSDEIREKLRGTLTVKNQIQCICTCRKLQFRRPVTFSLIS